MKGTINVVSLWRDQEATGFLCSGVLLDSRYLLTVAHAFDYMDDGDRAFVGLLPGKHGVVPVRLLDHHPRLDAALFELTEPFEVPTLRLPDDVGTYRGSSTVLHAVNPDTFNATSIDNYKVSDYSYDDCEYVLNPQTVLGYSGGVVVIGGELRALLNRRNIDDPMARAIALCELRPWIACARDSHSRDDARPSGGTAAAYDELTRLLGPRAMRILANEGTADLRRIGGFTCEARVFSGKARQDCFQPLLVDLCRATEQCLSKWTETAGLVRERYKEDCRALLGELIKLGVDRDRDPEELAEIDAATPDRMFVACKRTGTAAAVYSTLADVPLRLNARKSADMDVGGGSVIDLDDLAMGVGLDAQRDAFAAVWLEVKGEPLPDGVGDDDIVEILQDAIEMEHEEFGRDSPFIVARGPRNGLTGGGLATAGERLRIGLVIHDADRDYAYLAVTERRLINLVCKYLKLLETL